MQSHDFAIADASFKSMAFGSTGWGSLRDFIGESLQSFLRYCKKLISTSPLHDCSSLKGLGLGHEQRQDPSDRVRYTYAPKHKKITRSRVETSSFLVRIWPRHVCTATVLNLGKILYDYRPSLESHELGVYTSVKSGPPANSRFR